MRIVILGGGYAGIECALRLARRAREQALITLVSASPLFVDRIRLHQQASGQRLETRELASLLAGTGVELKLGRVTGIDPRGKVLVDGEPLAFDQLVVALGSQVDRDAVPGIREHASTLDAASSAELATRLPSLAARGGHLVVIGGGLTGVEGASELAEAWPGLRVTLLSAGPLGQDLSESGSMYLRTSLQRLGVTLEEGRVQRIGPGAIELEGRTLACDACLWAGGFVVPEVVRSAGLPVNARGQLLVDEYLRVVGHENLYAVGDAAALADPPSSMQMGCKTALPMGAHVADNLSQLLRGEPQAPFDYIDTAFCISLGRRDGLFQPISRDGTPTRRVLTGRLAAWLKEGICRGILWVLLSERTGLLRYRWRKTGRRLALAGPQNQTLPA
jgi:NADH dehydrogenase FAD-containing subunit